MDKTITAAMRSGQKTAKKAAEGRSPRRCHGEKNQSELWGGETHA